jgi:nicotinamide-nucleotide amidase
VGGPTPRGKICTVNATNDDRQPAATQQTPGVEQRIADALVRSERTAAAAESLTGGNVSAGLSAIQGASGWFRGAVVAYSEQVKFELLGVERGPVITAACARQMATGAARLLGADFAVATTGVGGPGPQEDLPEGTVFIAVGTANGSDVREYRFSGDPTAIVEQATQQALRDLAALVTGAGGRAVASISTG